MDPDEAEALSLFQSSGGGSIGPEASHHRRSFPPACIQSKLPNPTRLVLFVLAELLYTKGMDRVSFSQLYKKKKMVTCQCCCGEIARSASHIATALIQSELLIKLTLRAPLAGFVFFHWRVIKPERSCICADRSAPREAIK